MSVAVDELPAQRLPEQVELAAYFVVCEALAQRRYARLGDAGLGEDYREQRPASPVEISDDGVGGADVDLARACAVSPIAWP